MGISKTDIISKNLNLLVVFRALHQAGGVSEAAKRLGMSQPNLSRALKLLREEFQDPLFVRTAQGFAPTKRAEALLRPLEETMQQLEALYAPPTLDLKKVVAKFTIATTDYIEFLLAPRLSEFVEKEAPGVTLNFRPSMGVLPKMALESGECDLNILVVRDAIPPGFYIQDLFLDPYLCVVRNTHPILSGKCSIERFTEFGHVMISPQGTLWAITDERLKVQKKPRRLVLGTPNSLSAIAAISKSDLILTCSKRLVDAAIEFFPIETFESPFKIDAIRISQIWHERSHLDPLHMWLRKKIKEILK